MTTFTYTKPTVGGSEDTWGDTLNANWDAIAAFIGPLDSTELAVLDGITASTAELNLLDGVTASTAELNLLDGVPLTTDLSYVDGVTSAIQDQIDNIPAPPELTQTQAEDDTSTVFGQVSGQRLGQAVAAGAAGATAGAVGTYCFAKAGSDTSFGSTVAGSSLFPTSAIYRIFDLTRSDQAFDLGPALSGTWRAMGQFDALNNTYADIYGATLWLRIS